MGINEELEKDRFLPKEYVLRRRRAEKMSEKYHTERLVLVHMLGGKCSCTGDNCWHTGECGVTDIRCLQLDHIRGDGTVDRIKHGCNYGVVYYYYRHLDEARVNLQLLCANCNWVKRYNKDEVSRPGDLYFNGRVTRVKVRKFDANR